MSSLDTFVKFDVSSVGLCQFMTARMLEKYARSFLHRISIHVVYFVFLWVWEEEAVYGEYNSIVTIISVDNGSINNDGFQGVPTLFFFVVVSSMPFVSFGNPRYCKRIFRNF